MNSRTVEPLTERETECAWLWARGLATKEVAEQLFISENTVRSHMTKVYYKLNVKTRTQLRDTLENENGPINGPLRVRHGIEDIARFLATQAVARHVGTWKDAEAVIARDWDDRKYDGARRNYTREARSLMTWLGVEPSSSLPARV